MSLLIGDDTDDYAGQRTRYPNGYIGAYRVRARATGTVVRLSLLSDEASGGPLHLGIYADEDGQPGELLGQGECAGEITKGWMEADVSIPVVTGETYWLGFVASPGHTLYVDFKYKEEQAEEDEYGEGDPARMAYDGSGHSELIDQTTWTTSGEDVGLRGPMGFYGSGSGIQVLGEDGWEPTNLQVLGAGGWQPASVGRLA